MSRLYSAFSRAAMKRAALLLVLYTNALDPGSALLCDLVPEQTTYLSNGTLVETANQCTPDRIFISEFE